MDGSERVVKLLNKQSLILLETLYGSKLTKKTNFQLKAILDFKLSTEPKSNS
jgi:hypothetical protein